MGRHRGALSSIRPDDLAAEVLESCLERTGLAGAVVDEVVLGSANQAGEDARNVARMALLLAGLPNSVPGLTLNRLCGSGLSAINHAARQIACGDADVILAGGVESTSRAPLVVSKGDSPWARGHRTLYDTAFGWRFPNPEMEGLFPLETMGQTAENLAEQMSLSREDQDQFAFESHQKALIAEQEGRFDAERTSVTIPKRGGESDELHQDETQSNDVTLDRLKALRPLFRKSGSVTAGNSSPLNDGAACVVLASREALGQATRPPLARWVQAKAVGVNPRLTGVGPVPAIERLLASAKLELADIDLYEINETFAAQCLSVVRRLDLEPFMSRLNVNGGGIALGHPVGASGARIFTTLVHEMKRRGAKRGVAAISVEVGQGVATLVEGL